MPLYLSKIPLMTILYLMNNSASFLVLFALALNDGTLSPFTVGIIIVFSSSFLWLIAVLFGSRTREKNQRAQGIIEK